MKHQDYILPASKPYQTEGLLPNYSEAMWSLDQLGHVLSQASHYIWEIWCPDGPDLSHVPSGSGSALGSAFFFFLAWGEKLPQRNTEIMWGKKKRLLEAEWAEITAAPSGIYYDK